MHILKSSWECRWRIESESLSNGLEVGCVELCAQVRLQLQLVWLIKSSSVLLPSHNYIFGSPIDVIMHVLLQYVTIISSFHVVTHVDWKKLKLRLSGIVPIALGLSYQIWWAIMYWKLPSVVVILALDPPSARCCFSYITFWMFLYVGLIKLIVELLGETNKVIMYNSRLVSDNNWRI